MALIHEKCGCGSSTRIEHRDPEPIAADWRSTHVCPHRAQVEREVTKGAQAEIAYSDLHRTDSRVHVRTPELGLGLHATDPIDSRALARRQMRETA